MKIIEHDNRQISFPTEWKDYTLGQYQQILNLKEKQDKGLYQYEMEFVLDLVNVLTCDDVSDMPIEDVVPLMNECLECLSVTPTYPNTNTLEFEGVTYVFTRDLDRLTMGEKIEIDKLRQNSENHIDILHIVLAILVREGYQDEKGNWKQEKLNKDTVYERSLILQRCPVNDVLGMINFFLNGKYQ